MSDYPYCIHGVYVGGCGADYMCGACEMGDETPTVNELRSEIEHVYVKIGKVRAMIGHVAELHPEHDWSEVWRLLGVPLVNEVDRLEARIFDMLRLDPNPDSREWIYAAHREKIAEWMLASDEDQLWSLPGYVLDRG